MIIVQRFLLSLTCVSLLIFSRILVYLKAQWSGWSQAVWRTVDSLSHTSSHFAPLHICKTADKQYWTLNQTHNLSTPRLMKCNKMRTLLFKIIRLSTPGVKLMSRFLVMYAVPLTKTPHTLSVQTVVCWRMCIVETSWLYYNYLLFYKTTKQETALRSDSHNNQKISFYRGGQLFTHIENI